MNKQFNNKIIDLGKKMSIESKVNIVGSANIKRSIYYSDYDLFEKVNNKSPQLIYNHFRSLFEVIKSSDNSVITDFKLGKIGDEPLRWDYDEIMKKENKGVSFDDALKMKSIIKMDIITYMNGRFIEITEVYNICFNGKCNQKYSTDEVIKSISDEYREMVYEGNYMKSLKKLFSILKLKKTDEATKKLLLNYFNSPIGLLYRCKSDLESIEIILNYNKFNIETIRDSLQQIKETISAYPVDNNLEKISKIKTKDDMVKPLRNQINIIKKYINKHAQKFIAVNNI